MKYLILSLLLIFPVFEFSQVLRDNFDQTELNANWKTVKNLDNTHWSLSEEPGALRLRGSTVTLDDTEVAPVYFGRTLPQTEFEATTAINFKPNSNETAGFALRQTERQHFEFGIRKGATGRELFLRFVVGSIRPQINVQPIHAQNIPDGTIYLRVRGFQKYYRFSYSLDNTTFIEIGGVETKPLETSDGLKNLQIGLFATGNGIDSHTNADFDWFELNLSPKDPYADLVSTDASLPKGYTIFSVAGAEKGIIQKYPFITRPPDLVPADIEFQKGLVYAKYGTREMHVDLFRPKNKTKLPAVIIVHGGAWITGHYTMEDPRSRLRSQNAAIWQSR